MPLRVLFRFLFFCFVLCGSVFVARAETLLNASYDSTREFYRELNAAFAKQWQTQTGKKLEIRQSHGGSGKQARSVIDGLEADVVTLALAYDIDAIAKKTGFLPLDWQKRLPYNSAPYTSTIVFLVRKGNPKKIKDWNDLLQAGLTVVTPNPKTSGGGRWNYLAAWAYAFQHFGKDETRIKDFMFCLMKNVPLLDSGARAAMTTFAERKIGDVLLAWESEALLALRQWGKEEFEIVYPSISILTEPPVAWVDKIVAQHQSQALAQAYLEYLYSPEGQQIAVKHYYRPRDPMLLAKYAAQFPQLNLLTIDEIFGDWQKAQHLHFSEGGSFDQVYSSRR